MYKVHLLSTGYVPLIAFFISLNWPKEGINQLCPIPEKGDARPPRRLFSYQRGGGVRERRERLITRDHRETIVSGDPDERVGGKTVVPKYREWNRCQAERSGNPPLLLWCFGKKKVSV